MICARKARPVSARHATLRTVVALLAAGALLAGCGTSGGKAGSTPGGSGGRAGAAHMTIGMVSHSGDGDTFWDIVQNGARRAAAKDGVRFLYAHDKEGSRQAELIQSYIDQKVDGLIVTLAKPEAVKAAVQKAVAQGIPVVTVNSGGEFSAAYGALAHIGQDESVAGRAVGDELNNRHARHVLCVIHEQGNVSLEDRCAGVRAAFHGKVDTLDVDGTNAPASQSSIQAELQADPSLDTVVTLGAPIASLSVKAKQEAGSSARIATFDLNAEVVKLLKAKDVEFAVDQQPYLQGYEAVDLLRLHRDNADVLGGGKPVLTGPAIVTGKDVPELEQYTGRGTR
ncbi:sugar ABC transporter substrate-binding protein [Streptomyces sp. YGL11-2]|uniref:sugar ABC transporter substrate-binding protein n=1 Tax=Streptomyces sp. YGL11-2 TaxID=3414028 RepID=UPI003CEF6767